MEFIRKMYGSGLPRITTPYILWGLPFVYLCVAVTFYLRTYDSAQVKITITQMGIAAIFGLWLMEKLEERKLGLSKEFLPVYAPFVAFIVSGILSFIIQAPFKWVSLDDFMRRLLFMSVAVIVLDRVTSLKSAERLIKFLLWALFIAVFYGFIQFLDTRFFPPNPELGLDIFIWRQAFSMRVFSTFGNPNFFANYIVLMTPIVLSWIMVKRSVAGVCLLLLSWFVVVFTETKGAYVGLCATIGIWGIFYSLFFPGKIAGYIRRMLWAFLIIVPLAAFTMFLMAHERNPHSIPFRIYTWLSTYEMIREHPILGTGIGSFKVIYSAYRRPPIFHIEGKHNTETDHAENEHIEVMFDEGIVGFGIYVWFIFTVVFLSVKAFRRWQKSDTVGPPAYYLLGVVSGWLGMLAHNNFDVSIRFVSSGVYTGMLPALAVSLALSDIIWRDAKIAHTNTSTPDKKPARKAIQTQDLREIGMKILLAVMKVAAIICVYYVSYTAAKEFFEIQERMLQSSHPGDSLMVAIAWLFFIALMGYGLVTYTHSIIATRSKLSLLVPMALAFPMLFFWGWFRGDVHHNMGIVHSKQKQWDKAIEHYNQVIKKNPGFIMSRYFLGNVFNDRWDLNERNMPQWGDPPGEKRIDFDRALEVYEGIKTDIAPNYVQMHYHVGNLYIKRAELAKSRGKPKEVVDKFYEEAVRRYYKYQAIDPVYKDNFSRLGYALSKLGRYKEAQDQFKNQIMAYKCVGHVHDKSDAYINLANSYLFAGAYTKALATYKGYLDQVNPNESRIKSNFQMLLQRRKDIMQKFQQRQVMRKPQGEYGIDKSALPKKK
ncbi:O-antigen ligase family protein [Elusimicrobiota bacterium]